MIFFFLLNLRVLPFDLEDLIDLENLDHHVGQRRMMSMLNLVNQEDLKIQRHST